MVAIRIAFLLIGMCLSPWGQGVTLVPDEPSEPNPYAGFMKKYDTPKSRQRQKTIVEAEKKNSKQLSECRKQAARDARTDNGVLVLLQECHREYEQRTARDHN